MIINIVIINIIIIISTIVIVDDEDNYSLLAGNFNSVISDNIVDSTIMEYDGYYKKSI